MTSGRPDNLIILHVEDSEADAFLTEQAFKAFSSDVNYINAQDAEEAFVILNESSDTDGRKTPNIILLDINLPKMNGYEFIEKLKQDPRLRSIPVLFFSGSTSEKDVLKSYEHHGACYIEKPMDLVDYQNAMEGVYNFWLKVARLPQVH